MAARAQPGRPLAQDKSTSLLATTTQAPRLNSLNRSELNGRRGMLACLLALLFRPSLATHYHV